MEVLGQPGGSRGPAVVGDGEEGWQGSCELKAEGGKKAGPENGFSGGGYRQGSHSQERGGICRESPTAPKPMAGPAGMTEKGAVPGAAPGSG